MRKKFDIYIILTLGIVLGYLSLTYSLFRIEPSEAQCMRYFLNSDPVNPDCSNAEMLIGPVESQVGPYGAGYYVVLCVAP